MKKITLKTITTVAEKNIYLVDFLSRRFTYKNRLGWSEEISKGNFKINEKPVAENTLLDSNLEITWTFWHQEPEVPKDLPIIFEDDFILAVNKPAGLPCHAHGVFLNNTAVNFLKNIRKGFVSLAHRLDKETSGVLICAKDPTVLIFLMKQFETRQSRKTYQAIVKGIPKENNFSIDQPLGADQNSLITQRQKVIINPSEKSKKAVTRVKVIGKFLNSSHLEIKPLSGRLHQIRAHLQWAHLPILGDKIYGQPDSVYLEHLELIKKDLPGKKVDGVSRQMLHASEVIIEHPVTQEQLELKAPLPEDFETLLKTLKKSN
jgi:RluA family pseudouridine synthase